MEEKLLTIAIPCYNSQGYMRHAVDSLLHVQEGLEILIIDDGSTDDTALIAALSGYHPFPASAQWRPWQGRHERLPVCQGNVFQSAGQ